MSRHGVRIHVYSQLKFISYTVLLSLMILEVFFYGLSLLMQKDLYYKAPSRDEFLRYLAGPVDWTVGWVPSQKQAPAGFRWAPAGEGLVTPCISLYGDSITFGSEVSPEAAWGNILTKLLGCRVDNYGVGGYGTDQAYLYFKRRQIEASDTAPVVILSHFSENIVRNITQDFALIYDESIALKPRFVTDEAGTLRLIDIPRLTPADYDTYIRDMRQLLPYEDLLPGKSTLSKRRFFFPYFLSVPYVLTYKRFYTSLLALVLHVPPWFSDLYDPSHPSRALQLTRDILVHFVQDATQHGRTPVVFVLPTARDMMYFQTRGTWSYAALLTELHKRGVERVANLGPALLAKVGHDHICQYFCTNKTVQSGHYTEQGNKVLAEVVRDTLVDLNVLPLSPRPSH